MGHEVDETDAFSNRAEVCEALDDRPQNPSIKETIGDVIGARYHRREVVRGMLGVAAIASVVSPPMLLAGCSDGTDNTEAFTFPEVATGIDETHHLAEGYEAQILLRWGDPVFADAPPFSPASSTSAHAVPSG